MSYLRLDTPVWNSIRNGTYVAMTIDEVFIGIGSDLQHGFNGDIQEVWVTKGYLEPDNVPNLMNMNKVFDVSTMGYYKFQDSIGRLNDAMRDQKAEIVISNMQKGKDKDYPIHMLDAGTYPYCDTLPSKFA